MRRSSRAAVAAITLAAAASENDHPHPCARYAGVWNAPPLHTPTTKQVSVADGPLAGNGVLGITTAPHRDSWPSSPPNETRYGRQTLWIGSNTFWSANTYGADEAGAAWVPPSGGPFPHCEVPYSMLGIGGLTIDFVDAPPAATGGFAARQDLCSAIVSSNVTRATGPEIYAITSYVAADDNIIATNISCYGCNKTTTVSIEVWIHKGRPDEPFDQATCGPDNMPRGGAYILVCAFACSACAISSDLCLCVLAAYLCHTQQRPEGSDPDSIQCRRWSQLCSAG